MSVYFWDTSALAKYYHKEHGSEYVENLLDSPGGKHFVSEVTLVEMLSVTASKVRGGQLHKSDFYMYRKVFQQDLRDKRLLVLKLDSSVVEQAQKLVSKHGMTKGVGLRTLDAMQLDSAMALQKRGLRRFVTSDKRLLVAAKKEFFELVDPEAEAASK